MDLYLDGLIVYTASQTFMISFRTQDTMANTNQSRTQFTTEKKNISTRDDQLV